MGFSQQIANSIYQSVNFTIYVHTKHRSPSLTAKVMDVWLVTVSNKVQIFYPPDVKTKSFHIPHALKIN